MWTTAGRTIRRLSGEKGRAETRKGGPAAPERGVAGLDRRGMTLVEMLVAMVAAGLLMGAVYQVLLTNQRVYTVQREQIVGHQTIRAGAEVLFAELREVSAPEGDLLSIDEREVQVRVMRAFGLVCDINPSQSRVSVVVRGERFRAGQQAFVFVDNDPEEVDDDEWATSPIQSVSDDSCAEGDPVQTLNVSGLASGDFSGLRIGAPVRSAETYTYGVFLVDGDWYLGRRTGTASPVPLVGPLEGEEGLRLEYLAGDGSATTIPSEVRRIRVSLRTASAATDQAGNPVTDAIAADVFLRN